MKLATLNLVHKWGLGLAYQKRRLGLKLAGVWARGASEKNWDPYVILQPASNMVHKLGLGLAQQKQHLRPRFEGIWARGTSEKNRDPPSIFETIEASNLKFGT